MNASVTSIDQIKSTVIDLAIRFGPSLLARIGWLLTFALFSGVALQNLGVELLPLIAGVGVAGAGYQRSPAGAVLETFRSRGIVLPFPQREVRFIDR